MKMLLAWMFRSASAVCVNCRHTWAAHNRINACGACFCERFKDAS